jgi:hypothetical protein
VVTKLLSSLARRERLILALEDLHWADATTLELIDVLGNELDSSLIVVTWRSSEHLDPPLGREWIQVTLSGLPPAEMIDLLQSGKHGAGLSAAQLRQIAERSEGNPYLRSNSRNCIAPATSPPIRRLARAGIAQRCAREAARPLG